ncbi:MAG: MFS transporter [Pyrinomonadaceae bacterium]|nr:MFS transporter [Phycisphaerales bacterium]
MLRHKHFRTVWCGALISSVGGWMEMIGVQWQMAQITLDKDWVAAGHPGASLMMAYLGTAQLAPTLLLGIAGGVVADRVNRKKMLLLTQVILMVVAAFLAVASIPAVGWLSPMFLIGISLVNGITMAFNVPAWQVLTPRLVPREELTKAITLNGIQFNLARIVGPGLGGLLMAYYGPTALFVVNTVSFLGVILAVWSTPDSPPPARDGRRAMEQVREAVAFVFGNKGPCRVFLALVIFSILAAPLVRMLPLFIKEVYHQEERTFGIMLAVMGVGAVLGGLALKLMPSWYPKHHFIPLSMTLSGISVLLFSVVNSVYLASGLIFFVGVFWLWSFNSSMSAMQLLVDDRMRGRVLAVCNTAIFGANPLGLLLAGYIGHVVAGHADGSESGAGAQIGVGALSAVLVVAALIMLIWRTPEVDGIMPGQAGYDRKPGLIRGILANEHRPTILPPRNSPPMK